MNIHHLPTVSVLSDYVSICELDNLRVIRVIHPKATALISLFGGHVISFQPAGKHDLLWMSTKADLSGQTALRGGIPVCWPWFGKAENPSHGFARTSEWSLQEHRENDDGVIVSLTLKSNEETLAIWPHAFHLVLQIEITERLNVSLITTNKDDKAFNYGGALHTYINIDDIIKTRIEGVGEQYLSMGEVYTQQNAVTFTEEVDRIYIQAEPSTKIFQQSTDEIIYIENTGNNAVVVWNPWKEIAKNMADMPDDGYQTMVCVESCIHDRSVEVLPNQSHCLSTEISIK